MQELEKDFQKLYNSVNGSLRQEFRVPWAGSVWEEETEYQKAYADFWTAREHLCQRFGIDWEDMDLELFMNGALALEEDICRRMFWCTIEYAKRGFQL